MYKKRLEVDRYSSNSSHFRGIMNSKGQVTIFIILGLVILLAVVLVIVLRNQVGTFKPGEIIPTEKGKVERFLEVCMDTIGTQALSKLGLQGGYINVPDSIAQNGLVHLRTSPFTVVPYWAYGTTTAIPSLEQIKRDLDKDMETHLRSCVFDTSAFKEVYTIVEKSDITADTQILDGKVIFNVHWDVEIRNKAGEVVTEVINHVVESPVKLKKVYETARRVVEQEMKDMKLEDITQDLIALEHPQVPVSGMDISCSEKKWKVSEVKDALKHLLRVNIRELRVKGTDYVEFPEELPYYQNHYIWDLGDEVQNPEVGVTFSYEDSYPFSFEVSPRSGTSLKSNQLGGSTDILKALCLQSWKFVYDVSYPVLVTVRDETTGYTFKMALTVHLQKNIPNRGSEAGRTSSFLEVYPDEEYCAGAKIPMTIFSSTLVSNEESGVYDKQPLDKVSLSFTCLKYSCEMGSTEYNFANMGNVAAYRTVFPNCVGGIVRGSKSGYKDDWKRVVTSYNAEVQLELAPLYSFPVQQIRVLKHEIVDGKAGKAASLDDDETAVITFTYQKKDQIGVEPFQESSVVKSAALEKTVQDQQKLELLAEADFRYQIDVKVFKDETMMGGYEKNWMVLWDQLQVADTMVIHVPVKEKGSEEDRFGLLLGIGEYSALVPAPELMR